MNEAVARAIAGERAISGLTVKELAKAAGIPERTLMRILGAERPIRVDQLFQLAQAFGIQPHEIMERAESIRSRPGVDASLAADIAALGLSDRNRREVEAAAAETAAAERAAGEVGGRSGDERRQA